MQPKWQRAADSAPAPDWQIYSRLDQDFSHRFQQARETFGKYRPGPSTNFPQEPARGRCLSSDQARGSGIGRERAPACGRRLVLAFRVACVVRAALAA